MNVFLIEDHPVTVEQVHALIAQIGWTMKSAGTLREGIRQIEDDAFDVVLLDLGLPGSTISDALNAVTELASVRAVAILTGHPDQIARARALDNGAHGFIEKRLLSDGPAFIQAVNEAWEHFDKKRNKTKYDRGRKEIDEAEIKLLHRLPGFLEQVRSLWSTVVLDNGKPGLITRVGIIESKLDKSRWEQLAYFIVIGVGLILTFVQNETALIKGVKVPPELKAEVHAHE